MADGIDVYVPQDSGLTINYIENNTEEIEYLRGIVNQQEEEIDRKTDVIDELRGRLNDLSDVEGILDQNKTIIKSQVRDFQKMMEGFGVTPQVYNSWDKLFNLIQNGQMTANQGVTQVFKDMPGVLTGRLKGFGFNISDSVSQQIEEVRNISQQVVGNSFPQTTESAGDFLAMLQLIAAQLEIIRNTLDQINAKDFKVTNISYGGAVEKNEQLVEAYRQQALELLNITNELRDSLRDSPQFNFALASGKFQDSGREYQQLLDQADKSADMRRRIFSATSEKSIINEMGKVTGYYQSFMDIVQKLGAMGVETPTPDTAKYEEATQAVQRLSEAQKQASTETNKMAQSDNNGITDYARNIQETAENLNSTIEKLARVVDTLGNDSGTKGVTDNMKNQFFDMLEQIKAKIEELSETFKTAFDPKPIVSKFETEFTGMFKRLGTLLDKIEKQVGEVNPPKKPRSGGGGGGRGGSGDPSKDPAASQMNLKKLYNLQGRYGKEDYYSDSFRKNIKADKEAVDEFDEAILLLDGNLDDLYVNFNRGANKYFATEGRGGPPITAKRSDVARQINEFENFNVKKAKLTGASREEKASVATMSQIRKVSGYLAKNGSVPFDAKELKLLRAGSQEYINLADAAEVLADKLKDITVETSGGKTKITVNGTEQTKQQLEEVTLAIDNYKTALTASGLGDNKKLYNSYDKAISGIDTSNISGYVDSQIRGYIYDDSYKNEFNTVQKDAVALNTALTELNSTYNRLGLSATKLQGNKIVDNSGNEIILAAGDYATLSEAINKVESAKAKLGADKATLNQLVSEQQAIKSLRLEMTKYLNSNKGKLSRDDRNTLDESIKNIDTKNLAKTKDLFEQIKQKAEASGKSADTFGQKLKNALMSNLKSKAIALVFGEISRAIKDVYQNVIDLDSAVTDLQVATGGSRQQTYELIGDYAELASNMGVATTDVAAAADEWLRQGKSIADTETLIQDSLYLSKLGQIESSEATTALTAIMKAYGIEASNTIDIVDKLTAVDMQAATSAGDIATGIEKTATSAKLAGVDLDNLIGYLTTIQETTQQDAESVGTLMKTVIARYTNIKAGRLKDSETDEDLSNVETALRSLNIEIRDADGNFRDFDEVLEETHQKWVALEEGSTGRSKIANAFGGTRGQNMFATLMDQWDNAMQYADVAENSAGTAIEKYTNSYLKGVEAAKSSMEASFAMLSNNILPADTVVDAYNALQKLIDGLNGVVNIIHEIGGLKTVFFGLTAAIISTVLAVKGITFSDVLYYVGAVIVQVHGLITGLEVAELKAILLKAGAVAAVTVAVMAVSSVISKINEGIKATDQLADEQAEKNKQQIEDNKKAKKSVDDLIEEYKKLGNNTNLSDEKVEELSELQNGIKQTLGDQAGDLDIINGKYDEQLKKLKGISEELDSQVIKDARNDYRSGKTRIDDIFGESNDSDWWLNGLMFAKESLPDGMDWSDFNDSIAEASWQWSGGVFTFDKNANVFQLADSVRNILQKIKTADPENYENNKIYLAFSNILDQIEDEFDAMSGDAETLINAKIAELIADGTTDSDAIYNELVSDGTIKEAIDQGLIAKDKVMEDIANAISGDVEDNPPSEVPITISASITTLDTTKEALDTLSALYQDFYQKGEVSYDTLSAVSGKLKDINGIDLDTVNSGLDQLAKAKTPDQVTDALNDLAYAAIEATYKEEDLANTSPELVAKMLESVGVTNSLEIATNAVNKAKAKQKMQDEYANRETGELILNLDEEANQLGITKNAFIDLVAQMKVFNNTDLNVEDKIGQLVRLAEAAGIKISDSDKDVLSAGALGYRATRLDEGGWRLSEDGSKIVSKNDNSKRLTNSEEETLKKLAELDNEYLQNYWNQIYEDVDQGDPDIKLNPFGDETEQDKWQRALAEKKHLVEMDKWTEEQFYAWEASAYKKYLSNTEENADTIRQIEEELYQWKKDQYAKERELEESRLELQYNTGKINNLKYQKGLESAAMKEYNSIKNTSYGVDTAEKNAALNEALSKAKSAHTAQYDQELEDLKRSQKLENKSAKWFYQESNKLAKKYYGNNVMYAEEWKKAQEEAHDNYIAWANEEIDALEHQDAVTSMSAKDRLEGLKKIRKNFYEGKDEYGAERDDLDEQIHDAYIDMVNEEIDAVDRKLAMNEINEEEAYRERVAIYDKYYKDLDEYADEYLESQEEMYKELTDLIDKWAKAAEDSVEAVSTAVKDTAEAIKGLAEGLINANESNFDRDKSKLKHWLDMNYIEEEDYYSQLETLYQKHFQDRYIYMEQYWENMEEIYEHEQEMLKDGASATEDIHGKVVDMIKKELEDTKDAIEEAKDAYLELIEIRKKALSEEKEKDDYDKEHAEKLAKVAELQRQYDAIANDDSAAAQSKRKSVYDQLVSAQSDLYEFERNHAYDVMTDELDKEQEVLENSTDAQNQTLEEKLNDNQALVQEAWDRMATMSDSLYQQLIDYNKKYSTSIKDDVTESWKAAQEALTKYNSTAQDAYATINSLIGVTGMTPYDAKQDTAAVSIKNAVDYAEVAVDALSSFSSIITDFASSAASIINSLYDTPETRLAMNMANMGGSLSGLVTSLLGTGVGVFGLAKGTDYVKSTGIYRTDEFGTELKMLNTADGNYTLLTEGSKVVDARMTERLMKVIKNPELLVGGAISNMMQDGLGISKPSATSIVDTNYQNVTVSPVFQINSSDPKGVANEIQKQLPKIADYTLDVVRKNARMSGKTRKVTSTI